MLSKAEARSNGPRSPQRRHLFDIDKKTADEQRLTALQISMAWGATDIARLLLRAGANVNAQTSEGSTALHLALQYSKFSCAKKFLDVVNSNKLLFNPDLSDATGCTVLHKAMQRYNGLSKRWQSNQRNRRPSTRNPPESSEDEVFADGPQNEVPEYSTAISDLQSIIYALIAAGARVNVKNNDGKTPQDFCTDDVILKRIRRKSSVPRLTIRRETIDDGTKFASPPQERRSRLLSTPVNLPDGGRAFVNPDTRNAVTAPLVEHRPLQPVPSAPVDNRQMLAASNFSPGKRQSVATLAGSKSQRTAPGLAIQSIADSLEQPPISSPHRKQSTAEQSAFSFSRTHLPSQNSPVNSPRKDFTFDYPQSSSPVPSPLRKNFVFPPVTEEDSPPQPAGTRRPGPAHRGHMRTDSDNTGIQRISEERSDNRSDPPPNDLCSRCHQAPREIALVPCGHCFCKQCCRVLNHRCPTATCGAVVESKLTLRD